MRAASLAAVVLSLLAAMWGAAAAQGIGCWQYENEDEFIVGSTALFGDPAGVAVSGTLAFVAADWFYSVDVVDPRNPVTVGSLVISGIATDVVVAGGHAYVATRQGSLGGEDGLDVVDISDPANLDVVAFLAVPDDVVNGVAVSGDKVYLACEVSRLIVVDVSEPTNPTPVGVLDPAPFSSSQGIAVSGGYAYLACDDDGLFVVDIGDPQNPVVAGSVDTPGQAFNVALQDGYAFVADRVGLQAIDVADPRNPALAGQLRTQFQARNVAVSGSFAYVSVGNVFYGLQVIRVSDRDDLQLVGGSVQPTATQAVAVVNGLLYVCNVFIPEGDPPGLNVMLPQCEDVVAVEEGSENPGPSRETPGAGLRLAVHPNPFNPRVTVSFTTSRSGWTDIGVYDPAGRRVATLASRTFTSGSHTLAWDGRDTQGRAMPSGPYIVRLEADSEAAAQKVMLVR
jgi:hypothetical protein